MTEIVFNCDRCGESVKGVHSQYGTGNFYVVSERPFNVFACRGEHFVCDKCIQGMPLYKEIYGWGVSAP